MPPGIAPNKSLVNLFKEKRADLYSRPDDLGTTGEYLESSQPVMSEPFHVAQLIRKPSPEKADFSDFVMQNQPLIFKYLLGFLLTLIALVALWALLKTIHSPSITSKQTRLPFHHFLFLESKPIELLYPQLSFIILAFEIFAFIILSLISNSIKTQKVVVNTDMMIDSASRFEQTPKLPCFFREEDIQIVLAAPANSFLSRMFNGKIRSDLCTLSKKYNPAEVAKIKQTGYDKFFYFMKRTTLLILLSYLSRDANNFLVFRKPVSYYEMPYVIYSRRSLETTKKRSLFQRIRKSAEAGLFENMFQRIEKDLLGSVSKRIDVYESLEDFVYDYSKIEVVQLENYKKIFAYHVLLLSCLFVVFLARKGYLEVARPKKKKRLRSTSFQCLLTTRSPI